MTSSAQQMYPPHQMHQPQAQQPLQMQYQPPPPYPSPYSFSATYANSLISAYGQLPPPPTLPQQQYAYDQPAIGVKRSSDDVLQAVDLLSKRPRPDSGGTLAFYPQRPGEKLCAFYMTTRTCSFGLTCKFDHPSWVPYGGIPNWKEVTSSASTPTTTDPMTLPQRAGEQNCAFYMKTGDCKYGGRCKFNHPKDRHVSVLDVAPQAKDETLLVIQNGANAGSDGVTTVAGVTTGASISGVITTPASTPVKVPSPLEKGPGKIAPLNSKGFPLRQHETECTYYIKTGSCKFGASCRFHHPEVLRAGSRVGLPLVPGQSFQVNVLPSIPYTTADINLNDSAVVAVTPPLKLEADYGLMPTSSHPQRPGGPDCTYYLKTGECSFGATCKFHHPLDRQPSVPKVAPKLTLAGLPRREGEIVCAYYMKTGACKYGPTCRFDHPPPGEVAAKAAAEATRIEAPAVVETFDAHQSQVPMQYVDLNPSSIMTSTTAGISVKQEPTSVVNTTVNSGPQQDLTSVLRTTVIAGPQQEPSNLTSTTVASDMKV